MPSRTRARGGGLASPANFFSFQDLMMATIGVIMVVALILVLHVVSAPVRTEAMLDDAPVDTTSLRRERDDLRRLEAALMAMPDPLSAQAARRAEHRGIEAELDVSRLRIESLHGRLRALAEASNARPAVLDTVELMRLRDELDRELGELRRRSRIVYIVDKAERQPTIIEISGGRVILSSTDPAEPPIALDVADPAARARLVIEAIRSDPQWRDRYPLIVLKPSGLATWKAIETAIAADPELRGLGAGLDLIAEEQATTEQFPAGESLDESDDDARLRQPVAPRVGAGAGSSR